MSHNKIYAFNRETARDANRLFSRTRREPYNLPVPEEEPRFTGGRQTIIGKLDEPLSQDGFADVVVWVGTPNEEVETGEKIRAYDWLMKAGDEDIPTDIKVVCTLINRHWYVTAAECP